MSRVLRSLRFGVFGIALALLSLGVLPISILLSLLTFRRCPPLSLVFLWRDIYLLFCSLFLGIRYRVEGRENLLRNRPLLLAVKHQSLWETIALHRILSVDLFIAKESLRMLPLWGWSLYLSRAAIFFNRKRPVEGTRKLVHYIKWRLQRQPNLHVAIFPEGSRSLPNSPADYKRGVAFLYERLDMEVVPVALNSGYVWPKKGYERAGTITVSVLPPLPRNLPRAEFLARLQQAIESETKRIGIP